LAQTLTLRAYGRTVELAGSSPVLELARERLPPSYRPASGRAESQWSIESDDRVESVLSSLELWVAEHARRVVFVHAGCVVAGGRAILIPGRSHAGKTTLTAALVRAGALYYSDEYAVIDHRGLVRPYARPLSIRTGSAGAAGRGLPARARVPVGELGGTAGRGLAARTRVPVGELGGTAGRGPAPVGLVAVLRYGQAGWQVEPASRVEASMHLLQNAVAAQSRPRACLSAIMHATDGARALHGTRGEADEAAQILLEMLRTVTSSYLPQ